MSSKALNGIEFRESFQDGFLTRREAKLLGVDSGLRTMVNSRECHQGDCVRLTETEAKAYVDRRGDAGLVDLMVLQKELQASFLSPRAHLFLHRRAMAYLETLLPELNIVARDAESLTLMYREKILRHVAGAGALRFEMPTGFSSEQSNVQEIRLFHDLLLDGSGVYLAADGEANLKAFTPAVKQLFAVHEKIQALHEIGYSMEPVLRVFRIDEHYVVLDAFRWRREGEDPSNYVLDADGQEVPSDVQEVVLKLNTVTGEIVDEQPGQLPR